MKGQDIKAALVFYIAGLLCGGVIGFGVGRGTAEKGADGKIITTDTITRYDTLLVKSPTARDSIVVKYITKTLPKSGNNSVENISKLNVGCARHNSNEFGSALTGTTFPQIGNIQGDIIPQIGNIQGDNIPVFAEVADSDSVAVEIPITQKRYDGDDYRAWVSGYEARLDSIHVLRRTEVVTVKERAKRFGVGVQAGVGFGLISRRIEPYIGVGVNYKIY